MLAGVWEAVALIVCLVPTHRAAALDGWLTVARLALCLFFGLKANRMAIDHYLARGWVYADKWRHLLEA